MSVIRRENFINIQGWMITDLNLKGNDLLIYAIIYGFTQDGQQWFEGSRQYLAEWCNSTKKGISKNLDSLTKKGYIIKEEQVINNVKFCKYKANLEKLTLGNKVPQGGEQSSLGGGEQSSPNNIDIYNIEYNKLSKKEKEKEKSFLSENKKRNSAKTFNQLIEDYTDNKELRYELKEHLATRKLKKGALTNRAIEISLQNLSKLANNDSEKIAIVQKSIQNGWIAFYPLKEDEKSKQSDNVYNDYEKYVGSDDYLDILLGNSKQQNVENEFPEEKKFHDYVNNRVSEISGD